MACIAQGRSRRSAARGVSDQFAPDPSNPKRAAALPTSALRTCPFDGGSRLHVIRTARYDGEYVDDIETPDFYAYHVHCTSCAADGPWQKSQSSAELFWNGIGEHDKRIAQVVDAAKRLYANRETDERPIIDVLGEWLEAKDALYAAVAALEQADVHA
jgi:hypothetical protein